MWKMLREWMGTRPVLAASTMTLACLAATADGVAADASPKLFLLSVWPTMAGVAVCVMAVTMIRRRMGLEVRSVLGMLKWTPVVAVLGYMTGLGAGYAEGTKSWEHLHYIVTDGDWFIGAVMAVFSLWVALMVGQLVGWGVGAMKVKGKK